RRPSNLFTYIADLLQAGSVTRDYYLVEQMARTVPIQIETGDTASNDFTLTMEDKRALMDSGRQAAGAMERFIGQGTPSPPPSAAAVAGNDDRAEAGASQAMTAFNSTMSREVRNRVFISYSHKDKPWLELFQVALKPYTRT